MTEAEWLTSEDPAAMLAFLTRRNAAPAGHGVVPTGKPSDRKLRSWVEACRRAELPGRENYPGYNLDDKAGLRRAVSAWEQQVLACSVPGAVRAALLRDIVGNPFRPVSLCGSKDHGSVVVRPYCPACQRIRTPTVLSLATAACEERRRPCPQPGYIVGEAHALCARCLGAGVIDDGTLDPFRLMLLADALEEAGGGSAPCPRCWGEKRIKVVDDPPRREEWVRCDILNGKRDTGCAGSGRGPSPILPHLRSPGPHVRGCWALDLVLGKE